MKTHDQARKRKDESLTLLRQCLDKASIAILTDYRGDGKGLTVKQITELRTKLRAQNGEYRVVKNSLTKRVARDLGISGLESHLEGPTAIAFGYDDPAALTKTLLDFAAELKPVQLPVVKTAYMEGEVLAPERLKAIADLPSREQLIGQLLGLMLAPHRQLLGVMNAPGRQVATVIDAWRKKMEESGGGAPEPAAEAAETAAETAPAAEAQAEAATPAEGGGDTAPAAE